MPALGPGIGEEDVKAADGARAEQMLDGVGALDAEEAQIGRRGALGFAAGVARSGEEALGADVIALRMLEGHGDQE